MNKTGAKAPAELRARTFSTWARLLIAFVLLVASVVITGLPEYFGFSGLTIVPVIMAMSSFSFLALSTVSTLAYLVIDKKDAASPKEPFSDFSEQWRTSETAVFSRFIIREVIDE